MGIMEQKTIILDGYSDLEKGAYLGAIASLATADRSASEEEMNYIDALNESAGLSAEQSDLIRYAAQTEITDDDLERCLDVLKSSDLRFSLVSDLVSFAEADQSYSEDEKHYIEKVAAYLDVNQEQLSLLNQFTKKATEEAPKHVDDQESTQGAGGFLNNLGFGDKLKNAGINTNGLLKGALGIIGPLLLAKMFSGGRRSRMGSGGGIPGGAGGMLGGLLGGGGGLLGGLLGGGRGLSGAGGLLGRLFGGRRGF